MICVSISDPAQITPTIQAGAELIELRLDLLQTLPGRLFPKIPEGTGTVVTCRPGVYSETERIGLMSEAVEMGATYVDIELEASQAYAEAVMKVAAGHRCTVIFSHHDFKGTPGRDDLRRKLEHCYERGGVVAKIATQVNNMQEIMDLLSLYELPGRKVVLGMGSQGRITRVIGPYLGGEFTFASPEPGNETAPGQLCMAELKAIFKAINAS
jgi:3-dehydroquinate dehydratase type I